MGATVMYECMDLRDDGQRNRLRGPATERQSHRRVQPRADPVRIRLEIRKQPFAASGRTQQSDIRNLGRSQGP